MKFRLSAAVLAFVVPVTAFGQTGLTGKWQTDNVPAALEAQKNAPAAAEGRGGRGGGGGQAIIMDLQADASGKVSGTVTEIGNPPVLNIESGATSGKTVTWVTQPRGVMWSLEMTDDNTLTLMSRTFAGRGGGGARAATAPPAEGTGRGRGLGRGPQQPIVLHRVK